MRIDPGFPARFAALALVLAAGCVSYRPAPLDEGALLHELQEIRLDAVRSEVVGAASPGKASVLSVLGDRALSADEAVAVALFLNPELRASRKERGVAEGQLVSAGLLPNPTISDAAHRRNAEQIETLLLKTPSGARVPLAQVASVLPEEGPPAVNREHARRRVVVQCNVRGRDLGGFVEDGRKLLDRRIAPTLPPGYSIQWGGQFENQQRAQRTLSVVVPLSILMIFVLLVMSFGNARSAALILLNVPFSLIGGVIGLFVSGQYLSVPSSIGFIAVFGVAVLNGVVLVAYIRQLRSEGMSVAEAAVNGALLRIRPVLMTALVAILGLVPLVLSSGIGSEVQRPLATVVIGGIVTSTLLTLIVLPAIFRWFDGQRTEVEL